MRKVKVSILIPTYNSERYIEETIESALSQTYEDFEIIIVDNASSDRTWKIVQEYQNRHHNFYIFRNEENIGPIRNWMRCIEEASGEYGKILWSDDLIKKTFLEQTVDILAKNRDVGFVLTPAILFGDISKEKIFYTITKKSGIYCTTSFIEGVLLDKDYPSSPACGLFRLKDLKKNLLLKIPNRFDSDASIHAIGNDLLIYLLTAKDYKKFAYVNEPLALFRAHDKSISTSTQKTKMVLNYDIAKAYFVDNFIDNVQLIRKFNALLWLHNKVFKTNQDISKFYFNNKEYKKDFVFLIKHLFTFDAYIKRAFRKFF